MWTAIYRCAIEKVPGAESRPQGEQMSTDKKVTRNLEQIIAELASVAPEFLKVTSRPFPGKEHNFEIEIGDLRAVEAHYAAAYKGIDQLPLWQQAQAKQAAIIRAQMTSGFVQERPYSLGHNIYGWAVGSTLLSNLGGGRWAATVRGATLEECFTKAISWCRSPGTSFTFQTSRLPDDVRRAVERQLGIRQDEEVDADADAYLKLCGC
jgi:hypothetical protein